MSKTLDGSIEGERKGNIPRMSVVGKFEEGQRVCHQFRNDTSAPKRYGRLKTVDGIRGAVQWDDNGKVREICGLYSPFVRLN
jgi:hypothetical protein